MLDTVTVSGTLRLETVRLSELCRTVGLSDCRTVGGIYDTMTLYDTGRASFCRILSDYCRSTVGLSDCRTVGLSDCFGQLS